MRKDLTLRGFLSHIQSLVRKRATLVGEYVLHPENTAGKPPATANKAIQELWEVLQRDLKKVLDVDLCDFGRLVSDPSFDMGAGWERGLPDPYRITMGTLKVKADKARMKDPTITLLDSVVWDPTEKD